MKLHTQASRAAIPARSRTALGLRASWEGEGTMTETSYPFFRSAGLASGSQNHNILIKVGPGSI